MGMIQVIQQGNFNNTEALLKLATSRSYLAQLESMGVRGVDALRAASPVETGELASSWWYSIERTPSSVSISWHNSAEAGSAPLAVIVQLGHGTRGGGYVEGQDYINPAMIPIFDEIAYDAWMLLTK